MRTDAEHPLVGLDLNATRAQAVARATEGRKQATALETDHPALPVARQFEGRRPEAVPAPLAAAWTAFAEQPWCGPAVVLDADERALTVTGIVAEQGKLRLAGAQVLPHLGCRAWKERLLHIVADRCIQQSRRDPRE